MITFTFNISTIQGCELSEELFSGLSFELMEPKNPLRIFFGAEDFLALLVFLGHKKELAPRKPRSGVGTVSSFFKWRCLFPVKKCFPSKKFLIQIFSFENKVSDNVFTFTKRKSVDIRETVRKSLDYLT